MSENQLPNAMTPIDPKSLYAALKTAAPAAIGAELSRASLLVLLAQIAEETGWRSCHQYNLGNIKHVAGDAHDYCEFEADEIIDGKRVVSVMQFRAYGSLALGCVDYLALLHRRFGGAWTAALAGDPHSFVRALAAEHYFTASEELYEASVVALDEQLAKEIPDEPGLDPMMPLLIAALTQGDKLAPIPHDPPPSVAG